MNRDTGAIIYCVIAWIFIMLMAILMSSCGHKTYESVIRDATTVERLDTVLINIRPVKVEVPVPQINLEHWVSIDSISVLDNGLYVSTVEVVNGQIHHTLKPVEGASIGGTVQVADTTHITHETITNSHHEKETVTVKEKESWWDKVRRSIGSWVIGICVFIVLVISGYFAVRRFLKS